MTVGFEDYYEVETNDTPKALLVSVSAYVFLLLAVVLTLITRPNPSLVRAKPKTKASDTSHSRAEEDDEEDHSQALGSYLDGGASQVSGLHDGNGDASMAGASAVGGASFTSHTEASTNLTNSAIGGGAAAATGEKQKRSSKKSNSKKSSSKSKKSSNKKSSKKSSSTKKSSSKSLDKGGEVEMTTPPPTKSMSRSKSQQSSSSMKKKSKSFASSSVPKQQPPPPPPPPMRVSSAPSPKVQHRQPPSGAPFPHHNHHHAQPVPSPPGAAKRHVSSPSLTGHKTSKSALNHSHSQPHFGHQDPSLSNHRDEPRPEEQQDDFPRPLRSWDLMSSATMRFRHGHFSGRSVQRLVQQERHASTLGGDVEGGSSYNSSWNSRGTGLTGVGGGGVSKSAMSHTASEVLEEQTIEGEAEYYRQRYLQKQAAQRQQQQQMAASQPQGAMVSNASLRRIPFRRGPSSSATAVSRTSSGRSRMQTLDPNVLSPDDAADAFDPGTSLPSSLEDELFPPVGGAPSFWGNLLDLAEPDNEVRRILFLAAPSTLGAVAEPCFRLGLVAIISHFLDTDAMVAFVLVILFLRITTEELSGAITDAESSLLHQALSMGGNAGFTLAGRHVQLAMGMQLLFGVPLLVIWSAVAMDPLVSWLIPENDRIGSLARQYAGIIAIEYALQMVSRAFMLVFHMTGQAQFELQVDLIATGATLVAIALVASLADKPTLNWIGGIQVLIGAIKICVKVGIVSYRGLLQPYRKGLVGSCSLLDSRSVWAFCGTTLPLLMGSLIELREWEILVLFTRHLGGAEVATWALMGIVWEIFEASTEGLGEAAAVRVSLVLSENLPDLARQLAHKAVLLGTIESLLITSFFLLIGRNLSVALTQDGTLQTLFNDLVGMTGLANISMSLAQVYWSLLGAQGRFGAASSTILLCRWLLTMPLAALYIFAAKWDLRSVGSALAVGYMTATALLAWRLHKSDWKMCAQLAKEDAMPGEDVGLLLEEDEEDEDDDDDDFDFDDDSSDSTGFG